jgi:hypothetical protein
MRLVVVIALVSVAVVATAAVVASRDDDAAATRTGSLTMIGDSLNVGVEPYLAEELPGWRIQTDDEVGRGSDDGIAALAGIGNELGSVVVVSLGTNDPQEDPAAFREDVREVLSLAGPHRCVVWATIWRDGANAAFNEVLDEEAHANRALRLVAWHEMAAQHPEWLIGDGVHGSPEGYAARAAAIAAVARDCLPAATR